MLNIKRTDVLSSSQRIDVLIAHIQKGYIIRLLRFQERAHTRNSRGNLTAPNSHYGVKTNGRHFC